MKCRYKWRSQIKVATSTEAVNRILFAISAVSHIFVIIQPSCGCVVSEEEEKLFSHFISFLFTTWKTDRYMNAGLGIWNLPARTSVWAKILLSCRDRSRLILGQLLAYLVFPAEKKLSKRTCERCCSKVPDSTLRKRLLIVRMFANDVLYKTMLKALLDINLDYQYTMNFALHELAVVEEGVNRTLLQDIEKLIRFLRNLQIDSPFANLSEERLRSLNSDEKLSIQSYVENRNAHLLTMRQKASAIFDDEQIYVEQVSQIQLCHPEAVCHDPSSWPQSWELDPTEGPNRERRRLVPAHLRFDKQFILPEYVYKLENRDHPLPLSNLLSGRRTSAKEWNMVESLAPGERIKTVMQATVVRSTVESQGEVLIGDRKFYFFGGSTRTTQKGILQTATVVLAWDYDQVLEVYKRHNLLKDQAVEIFFSDGQTYLIAFEDSDKRNQFLDSLLAMDLPHLVNTPQNLLQSTTQLWREGSITNFEYLMELNKLAGRTFNDLMQYPVFPFILSDYLSKEINLASPLVYRNLSKPMAVQNKSMEQHYLQNYECLEQERKRLLQTHATPAVLGPYHYGSHYSNSGIVVHYLVRLPPFTEIALEYQDNNFDIADRLFNSVETTWRLSSYESTTDFKELIPEFFCCYDFLINREGLNLGVRQNGLPVNDVILPNWCMNSARLFVLIHRQALESATVTSSLHLWIDLIFGYKQIGSAAVQAINVFHPAVTQTYRDGISAINTANIDPISVGALETMVRTYGQMPTQLFLSPHLPHMAVRNLFTHTTKSSLSPLTTVMGLRWGEFVGSPDSEFGDPVVVLRQHPSRSCGHLSHLQSFPDGSCYAYPDKTWLLSWAKSSSKSKDVFMLGFLSWRFSDSLVRMCLLGSNVPTWRNLIDLYNFKVTAVAFSFTSDLLFVALTLGVTRVYRISADDTGSWKCAFLRELFAHDIDVSTISICSEYAVAATGCLRGKLCIWDTNKLSYVRTLFSCPEFCVMQSCISCTTCDIGVFLQSPEQNVVKLYTVNGDLVGEVTTEVSITAMCMTTLPEGTAVNCLVLGMENGVIRFLNMWTMQLLRDISHPNYMEPIVSLTFSSRCTRLFACLASGCIVCWQGGNLNAKRLGGLTIVSSSGTFQKPTADSTDKEFHD
ncbi:unnamed protein product [Enterobius vermicularis]|uniref:BEACH domain-containing protein n=1 Tax=Enterobius vermicularis TaxID=51028 RepID=A0A0N4V5Y0_ENTVE|nr:unnamed protein product [Enterobius vermicularis]